MNIEKTESSTTGKLVLNIPLEQLLRDPHQPRKKFKEDEIEELTTSIRSQGLQQLPTVNFAFKKDGKDYYYIKAGERRWRAFMRLGKAAMECVVEEKSYGGVRSSDRRLAQAAENSSRIPQTHGEIIELVEEVIQDEIKQRNGKQWGAVHAGLERVAKAFGKKLGWATNYQTLTGLVPELREMLDEDEKGDRLNFNVGIALARAPTDVQKQLLLDAEPYFKKGGHAAGYRFIVQNSRKIRESRGEKIRGRSDTDMIRIGKTADRLRKLAEGLCGDLRSTEYVEWVESLLDKMCISEIDVMRNDIKLGIQIFSELLKILEIRKAKHARLSFAKR